MIPICETSIEFLCAFETGPQVAYLLSGCSNDELRKLYLKWIANRVEWTCRQLDGLEGVNQEGRTMERLNLLSYFVGAACIDRERETDNLRSAHQILETILAERGDR